MTVTASQLFSFLDQHRTCSIERREIYSSTFGQLRRSVRLLIVKLYEIGDHESQETADRLRTLLSEWLTVPVQFDSAILESVTALGDSELVERVWGHEIRVAYENACASARLLKSAESPARAEVRGIVERLQAEGAAWKIYCHRRARPDFESIVESERLSPDIFLYSVKDYREVAPFDVLLKMGPLRSKGWGAAPDALLSAPRFAHLVQVVWSGCGDEDDFGYDPAASVVADGEASDKMLAGRDGSGAIHWMREIVRVGRSSDVAEAEADDDELELFRTLGRSTEVRRATLLQVDQEQGILFSPHAQVATFDPAPSVDEPIDYRLPAETLGEGMFLIWPLLGSFDLGDLHAGEGRYSRIWKERLKEETSRAPDELVRRLQAAGVELQNLRSCVRQWCRPPSTVIHAPKQRRHFEILVNILGIDHESATAARKPRRPWWECAWSEICRTRGEAIQTGIQEHEIVDEQLFAILHDLLPVISQRAVAEPMFELDIPDGWGLTGVVRLYKIRSLEDSFLVPETALRVICNLDTFEQWRV